MWAKERTRLDIDEFQSRIVASIFQGVIDGKGLTQIAKGLNSRGIASPRGNIWSKTSIHKMLKNEVYTGNMIWGRRSKRGQPPVRANNACPVIVQRQTLRRVQGLLRDRSFARVHPRRVSI